MNNHNWSTASLNGDNYIDLTNLTEEIFNDIPITLDDCANVDEIFDKSFQNKTRDGASLELSPKLFGVTSVKRRRSSENIERTKGRKLKKRKKKKVEDFHETLANLDSFLKAYELPLHKTEREGYEKHVDSNELLMLSRGDTPDMSFLPLAESTFAAANNTGREKVQDETDEKFEKIFSERTVLINPGEDGSDMINLLKGSDGEYTEERSGNSDPIDLSSVPLDLSINKVLDHDKTLIDNSYNFSSSSDKKDVAALAKKPSDIILRSLARDWADREDGPWRLEIGEFDPEPFYVEEVLPQISETDGLNQYSSQSLADSNEFHIFSSDRNVQSDRSIDFCDNTHSRENNKSVNVEDSKVKRLLAMWMDEDKSEDDVSASSRFLRRWRVNYGSEDDLSLDSGLGLDDPELWEVEDTDGDTQDVLELPNPTDESTEGCILVIDERSSLFDPELSLYAPVMSTSSDHYVETEFDLLVNSL